MKKILVLFIIILTFCGCSSQRPKGSTEAEVVYKEALELVDDERFLLATEKLNSLRSQYPYSYYATHAELLQADILFKQENYVEAASAYILFKDFHPKHKKLDYVIWRIAESFYNQLPSTFDRDLSPGHEAIVYYRDLIARFPSSQYVKGADEKIRECVDMIEKKQRYIADFYYKVGLFDSARYRYLDILKKVKSKSIRKHAMLRIVESSLNLKEYDSCLKYVDQYKSRLNNDLNSQLTEIADDCMKKTKQ